MTIIKQEVKTIYNIEITFSEAWDLLMKFTSKDLHATFYPELAEFLKDKDYSIREVAKNIIQAFSMANWHSEMVKYFIEELGFDGVENFGHWRNNKDRYCCSVYKNGDWINR